MKPGSDTSFFRARLPFGLAVVVLLVLHQDFWLRDNVSLLAGLPVGLLYHVGYCVLVSLVLGLFLSRGKR
jgi:hypothetical protein